jgi:YqaJ-like recombinase protein
VASRRRFSTPPIVAKDWPIPRFGQDLAAAAARATPLNQAGEVEVLDVVQGTDEWLMARLGMPTASVFSTIMADGRDGGESLGRRKLLYQLAGELLTGEVAEAFTNAAMLRGKEMEPEACDHYAFTRDVELERVGFVVRTLPRGQRVGCSPDRFVVGQDKVLETKTMRPDLLIELAQRGTFPTEHRAQCHGTLWITGRSICDLMIFYRNMPVSPTFTVERDELYIRQIAEQVEVFAYELKKVVEQMRNMGGRR